MPGNWSVSQWLIFLLIVIVVSRLLPVIRRMFGIQGRTAKQVAEWLPENPIILDVRSAAEFSAGAYPGARNIPVGELGLRCRELGRKDRKIIVYCASGGRSSMAVRVLANNGYTSVLNAGGLADMPRPGAG